MDKKIYGIFVAGGRGTRMGAGMPKQFLPLGGRPVLMQTLLRFAEALPQMKPVVVLPRDCFDQWKELCSAHSFQLPHMLVAGGITRFQSVRGALAKVPDGEQVFVHDGVRPLVSVDMIRRMAEMASGCRALVPVLPVTDTLRSADPSLPAPDRSRVCAVQTPQFFRSEELKAAYSLPYRESYTDDSSVAEQAGIPVTCVPGEKLNIKITTPEDLLLAEAILNLTR